MKSIKTIILFCIISQISLSAQRKNIQFEYLNAEHGLSANTVFSIIQDSKGYIWIGTYDGLNKFDGYSFTVYKNIPGDNFSISNNRIRAICEDSNGSLWIGTWGGGLNKFDYETNTFKRYLNKPDDNYSLSNNDVFSICEDKNGLIWIGTNEGGLNQLDPKTEKFISYKNNPEDPASLSNNSIYSLYVDSNGILWIGTAKGGLNRFDKRYGKFVSYKHNPDDSNSISNDWVMSISEDRSGNLWVGTFYGGLNKFDRADNKFIRYKNNPNDKNSLSDNCVWAIHEDQNGVLWVGTYYGGLNILRNDKIITRYSKGQTGLNDESVLSIYEDRSGVLWFGTWYGGINKFDKSKEKFITYIYEPDNPNSLSDNGVNAIFKDRAGILWIGTAAGGLNRIDESNNIFYHYKHDPDDQFSISSNSINSICEDKEGYLWIGTDGGGLNKFDRRGKKFIHYKNSPEDPSSVRNDRVSQVFIDSYDDLWVGTAEGGLDKFDRLNNKFMHYSFNRNEKSTSEYLFFSIYEDKDRNLWVGTYGGGLNIFKRETNEFINFNKFRKSTSQLSNDLVSAIYKDKSGSLWIGTSGGGLNRLINGKKEFIHYTEKDGLPNDMIYGILEDVSGNLWISTGRGLSKFNVKSGIFKNYDVEDGLQSNDFNQWASFKSQEGKMYFGGPNGLTVFRPEEIKDNSNIPEIVFTGFELLHKPVSVGFDSIWNRTILQKSVSETKEIELDHDDNVISFEFAALDFRNPGKNKYSYILEGFDKSWTSTDAERRFVTYTNLDPGKYIFRVKGSNNDGVWNNKGTSLMLIINPPWWTTWWAYSAYLILFVFALYGLRKYDTNRLNWKNLVRLDEMKLKEKEQTERMKSRFFANISHEFRTPLTLILGLIQKWNEKSAFFGRKDEAIENLSSRKAFKFDTNDELHKDLTVVERNARQLLRLVNQLLDLSKLEAGKLKLVVSKGNIVSFVKGISMSFESLAEKKDIHLKLDTKENDIVIFFDKDKVGKILINLLSNAFKFTNEGGEIIVSVNAQFNSSPGAEKNDGFIRITVKDTGIGISEEELPKLFDRFYQVDSSQTREYEGTGLGLALTKELVELHKGKLIVKSELGKGSEFIFELPAGTGHLNIAQIVDADKLEDADILDSSDDLIRTEDSLLQFGPSHTAISNEEKDSEKTIILVVEDNSDVREYIKDSLSDKYQIEEAVNGEQGLKKAEQLIPDLIVSDIMMPKMDGNELTRRIRIDEKTSHIPVILLTAKTEQESKLEGLEAGADDYLTKPFDTKELLVRIKNLIAIRRKLQDKFSGGEILIRKDEHKISSLDEKFLIKALEVVEKHLSEEDFSIEQFGNEVGMSRTQLHRKLKALTGKSASLYVRTIRLAKARTMIEERKGNISEIAYDVGFSSPAYFTTCFKEEFGYPPSDLVSK